MLALHDGAPTMPTRKPITSSQALLQRLYMPKLCSVPRNGRVAMGHHGTALVRSVRRLVGIRTSWAGHLAASSSTARVGGAMSIVLR
jgi:hypothetical protein